MFKKIISVGLLVTILGIVSSANVFAQAKLSDENQTISINKEVKNEKVRESFLKKEDKPNYEQKETMADYKKQKAQGKKFTTGTKVLIGVGIGAAILATILVVRFGINE